MIPQYQPSIRGFPRNPQGLRHRTPRYFARFPTSKEQPTAPLDPERARALLRKSNRKTWTFSGEFLTEHQQGLQELIYLSHYKQKITYKERLRVPEPKFNGENENGGCPERKKKKLKCPFWGSIPRPVCVILIPVKSRSPNCGADARADRRGD